VAAAAEPRDYDEERRLLFVALSRAKQYICLISGKPSKFFGGVVGAVDSDMGEGDIPPVESEDVREIAAPDVSFEHISRPITLAVHDIMGGGGAEDMETSKAKGKGMNYGTRVHKAAEMMANGTTIEPEAMEAMPELAYVRRVLDSLPEGSVDTETSCALRLDVDGRKVVLNGNIDLMKTDADTVRIFDWKTDATTKYRDDYRTQLSVYALCARRYYPDKKVEASIVWLSEGIQTTEAVDLLSEDDIRKKVSKVLRELK
jgi:hypothetical protein